MAKATYDFPDDIAFKDAARLALTEQFRKMMDNAAGTRAGEDIEALHDMRVGSRRLRAALSLFAKIFSKEDYRLFDAQIGDITDALGAVRDLDVQLDYLRNYRNSVPENEAYGIGRLIERRTSLREKERKRLLKALDLQEKERFGARFLKALDRAVPPSESSVEETE